MMDFDKLVKDLRAGQENYTHRVAPIMDEAADAIEFLIERLQYELKRKLEYKLERELNQRS